MADRPTQLARKYRSGYYRDGYAAGLEAAAKFVEDRYKCQDAKAAAWFGEAIRALNEDTPDVDT